VAPGVVESCAGKRLGNLLHGSIGLIDCGLGLSGGGIGVGDADASEGLASYDVGALVLLMNLIVNGLPGISSELFARLYAHFKELSGQVAELERQIKAWYRENAVSQRMEAIPGIGPLSASALAASIGDARVFKNGRQFAAWLGLVPRQCSSGGKEWLLGISKRGDSYLRTSLIHGARSVLLRLKRRTDKGAVWLARLVARRSPNVAAVALANKNARVIWALLAHGRDYQADYIATPAAA
jgi:transposase